MPEAASTEPEVTPTPRRQRPVMVDIEIESADESKSAVSESSEDDDDSDLPTTRIIGASAAAAAASTSGAPPAVDADAKFPFSWRKHQRPGATMPFYHNTATGTKTWELPSGVNATLQRGKRAAPSPPPRSQMPPEPQSPRSPSPSSGVDSDDEDAPHTPRKRYRRDDQTGEMRLAKPSKDYDRNERARSGTPLSFCTEEECAYLNRDEHPPTIPPRDLRPT